MTDGLTDGRTDVRGRTDGWTDGDVLNSVGIISEQVSKPLNLQQKEKVE